MFFSETGVRLKCFDVGQKATTFERDEDNLYHSKAIANAFGSHYGCKFDGRGHTWLFYEEYISLSYSYMTFVINELMEKKTEIENEDYIFDVEQYNYIISKRTALVNPKLIDNSNQLSYVLK